MRILRLELENFRRHRSTRIEMPDGVTAIVGPNGSGKSTLLEAIAFALFGPKAAGTGKELIRSEDAPPGDPVKVVLEMELAGQAVRIVRELRGKAQNPMASLEVDGHLQVQPVAGSSEQTTHAVERLLGLDRDGFFQTVVARQRDLDRLGRLKPAERREFILGLAGIGAVDGAIERARQRRQGVRIQLDEASRHVGDEAALAVCLAAAKAALGQARRARDSSQGTLAAAEASLVATRARLEEVRRSHAEHAALQRQAEALAHRVALLRATADRARAEVAAAEHAVLRVQELQPRAQELEQVVAELATAQGLVVVRQRRTQQATRIAHEEAVLQRARLDLASLPTPAVVDLAEPALAVEASQGALARLERDRAVAADRLRQADAEAARLAALDGSAPCPTCHQPITGDHLQEERRSLAAKRAAVEAALARLAAGEAQARTTAATAKAALAKAQADARQAELVARQREQAAHKAAAVEATLAALREGLPADPGPVDLDAARQRAEAARVAHTQLAVAQAAAARLVPARAALLEAERAAQTDEADLAGLRLRLATQPDPSAALVHAQRDATAAELAAVAERAAQTQALLAAQAAEQSVASAHAEVERDRSVRARVAELQGDVARWTAVVGAAGGGLLERFREHLVARTAPAINLEASQLLCLFTQGRYTELVLDDSYEVYMGDGGRLLPLERFSGGEQDLAHLALRLGISRLLATRAGAAEIRFLALDEVFSSLDSERCDALLGALRGLTGLYGQVLAVTHLERLRESFDHVVQVKVAEGASLVSVHNG